MADLTSTFGPNGFQVLGFSPKKEPHPPFVPTGAIKEAVRGRETDIIDALGIPWQKGRPHINCPYPEHPDRNPSWRWDEKRARASCSCASSDGVLDVVAKVSGIDFDLAKVKTAELLGRHDLIIDPSRMRYVRNDSASLLKPPPDRSEPDLPAAYLSFRLRVEVGAVLIPTTQVAGWSNLEYWDPPGTKGGKPIRSCIVMT